MVVEDLRDTDQTGDVSRSLAIKQDELREQWYRSLPFSGWHFVAIGTFVAIIGVGGAFVGIYSAMDATLGLILFYLSGVVAVFLIFIGMVRIGAKGANADEYRRSRQLNTEIIDLLEMIADQGDHREELLALRERFLDFELTHDELINERRRILRGESSGIVDDEAEELNDKG